ncbi:MAG: cyclase, partial [Candidatus Dormibacteraeota bacterium]|nr:cyclase [Candidatus Dormibacteraeota bacterium]
PLADDLTRIIVVIEYTAVGPFEKVGNMMRLQLRRVRLDLREFKKFITTQNEATGEWRGEIRDGEVVSEGEEGREGEEGQEEQPEPEAEEQDQDEESESDSGEEEEPEPEEPEEEPERPAARQPAGAGGGRRGGRR